MLTALPLFAALAAAATLVRDQVFFAGDGVLIAAILQREPDVSVVETKLFTVWQGRWQAPSWERVEVATRPEDGPEAAVRAWQAAGGSRGLRLAWSSVGGGLRVGVRTPSAALVLDAPALVDAGGGDDPHGPVIWRAGRATLTVDSREIPGVAVWEHLADAPVPHPRFGDFEMWVVAPAGGGLTLGRARRGVVGAALHVAAGGLAVTAPFEVRGLETRRDEQTGFTLPGAWVVDGAAFARTGGEAGHGVAPGGGPAVYDVSAAAGGGGTALVFHLRD